MMTNRLTVLAVCLAVGLGAVSEPSMAKKKKNNKKQVEAAQMLPEYDHPSGKGYPNGRPWQAMGYDFEIVKHKLDVLDYKVDGVKEDTETIVDQLDDMQSNIEDLELDVADIKEGIGEIMEDVDDIEGDVEMLKNTLDIEVSAGPATDTGITLYVQVAQNGTGVDKLDADAFSYGNSFPAAGAKYCGADCFSAGVGGVYMIELLVDGESGSYAGALAVSMEVADDDDDGDDDDMDDDPEVASGTALVTFDVEAAPEPEPI
jgi:regulator of replication initiation timing